MKNEFVLIIFLGVNLICGMHSHIVKLGKNTYYGLWPLHSSELKEFCSTLGRHSFEKMAPN
jgi:hypothetical protein